MSTRARVGIENADGTITSIYTHYDGYPEHHAPILLENYATEESLRALLALGDLSSLGPELGEKHDFDEPHDVHPNWSKAYDRDRGEDNVAAVTHPLDEWPDYSQEYEYVLRDARWFVRAKYDSTLDDWTPLDEVKLEVNA
jgi:hypothetical protein